MSGRRKVVSLRLRLVAPNPKAVQPGYAPGRRKGGSPPLALMQVAALTPPGVDVAITDENVESIPFDEPADLVGITALTAAAPRAYQIAAEFRSRGVPVVMGGIHASVVPEEASQHVDAVVIGEAEGVWARVVEDARRGGLQRLYRSDDHPPLDRMPSPRRDLIHVRRYRVPNVLQATRGCPFDCSYCAVTSFFGRTYRCRSLDAVMEEYAGLPDGPVAFLDDNIVGHPPFAQQLFARLKEVKRTFACQASATLLRAGELIQQAADAGCRLVFVGLETLSAANLAKVGKRINRVDAYRELVKRLHDHGIACVGSFMVGMDDDDSSVFDRTVDWAEDAGIDVGQFSVLTPFPGTRLYRELDAEGRVVERDWSRYDGTHVVFRPAKLSIEELEAGLRRMYARFYSWGRIARRSAAGLNPLVGFVNGMYYQSIKRWLAAPA